MVGLLALPAAGQELPDLSDLTPTDSTTEPTEPAEPSAPTGPTNPTDPNRPNHVIVWVETDDWNAFVETTSDQGWDYWERVVGWFFEL